MATTRAQRPPASAPTLTAPAINATGNYTVSWTAVAAATRYELEERLGTGNWNQIQNTTATSRALTGKASGSWGYRVRACNGSGCGAYSPVGTVAVLRAPATPTITYAHRHIYYNGQSVLANCQVSWTASAHAVSYELQAHQGAALYSGPATSVASPAYSVQYCAASYIVRACNSSGCSAWSSPPRAPTESEDPPPRPGDPPMVPAGKGEGK